MVAFKNEFGYEYSDNLYLDDACKLFCLYPIRVNCIKFIDYPISD